MADLSQLDQIKAFIRATGISALARRTKISKRTLHYLLSGEFKPRYETQQKLLREMVK